VKIFATSRIIQNDFSVLTSGDPRHQIPQAQQQTSSKPFCQGTCELLTKSFFMQGSSVVELPSRRHPDLPFLKPMPIPESPEGGLWKPEEPVAVDGTALVNCWTEPIKAHTDLSFGEYVNRANRMRAVRRTKAEIAKELRDAQAARATLGPAAGIPPGPLLYNLVVKLAKHDPEGLFSIPTDRKTLASTKYLCVIQRPMDLPTVKGKIEQGEYTTETQCAQDVRLVFRNACTFYGHGHEVSKMALNMLRAFETV
jgi:hypothetical protein